MAYRFGGLEYSFDDDTVRRIAARGGLLGLILCQHYITSGLHDVAETFDGSVQALCRHIDKLHELTGGYDHIAIGSDLDGYIKPALPGLEHQGRMADLQQALARRYGADVTEQISSGNALRVLRDAVGPQAAPLGARQPAEPCRLAPAAAAGTSSLGWLVMIRALRPWVKKLIDHLIITSSRFWKPIR